MEPNHQPPRPRFFWQAVLILLPVIILAMVGLVALLRDRAAVESEARETAEELAGRLEDGLGRRVALELSDFDRFSYQWFEHHRAGLGQWPQSENRHQWEAATTNYSALLADWQTHHPELRPEDTLANILWLGADGEPLAWLQTEVLPAPPTWLASFSPEQAAAWNALKQAEATNDASTLSNLANTFLQTAPLDEAAANARFLLLRCRVRSLPPDDAIEKLRSFRSEDRKARSEAGLALGSLVFAEEIRYARKAGPTEQLWREINDQVFGTPSILTPLLLDEIETLVRGDETLRQSVAAWRTIWLSHRRAGAIAELIRDSGRLRGVTTTNLWLDYAARRWFCVLSPGEIYRNMTTNPVTSVRFYPKTAVEAAVTQALDDGKASVPTHFGVFVAFEDEPLELPARWTRSEPPNAISSRQVGGHLELKGTTLLDGSKPGQSLKLRPELATLPGQPAYRLRVYVADSERLFAAYKQRVLWFGGLICSAVLASMMGVIAAHRAFHRQLQLNEAKSNFVSSVSHELRAPIASVRLLAEGLERGNVGEAGKQREYFGFIVQECRRLSSLIENVLDFSRIEEGRKQYDIEPTDLTALVQTTVKLMEPYAAEKGVKLECETSNIEHRTLNIERKDNAAETLNLEPRLPRRSAAEAGTSNLELLADGKALQQALVNLIDNAIKHSPKGATVTVGVETGNAERGTQNSAPASLRAPHSALRISVADHGTGIPPEEHKRIFERFYRRGSELRRETQGVGIGLSIVKHIVEAHGGRVTVQSSVGQGSRFTIELPMKNEISNLER